MRLERSNLYSRAHIFETLILRFIARANFRYFAGLNQNQKSVSLISRISRRILIKDFFY